MRRTCFLLDADRGYRRQYSAGFGQTPNGQSVLAGTYLGSTLIGATTLDPETPGENAFIAVFSK
jgi:hypothetical protein